jgi:Reverse transcriptase (RNA-dependent DNA polymerase)
MKELGELNHFLGLEIEKTQECMFLCQYKYAKDLLETYNMLECKPLTTPMEPNAKLRAGEGKDLDDEDVSIVDR